MTAASKNEKRITKKVPGPYRRPMSPVRYRRLLNALPDPARRNTVESVFTVDDHGRHVFTPSGDATVQHDTLEILKAVHRARRGPRVIRLVILFILLASPVVFNLFFLDRIASRALENVLEGITATDITVNGLDIRPLAGRIDLNTLAFASRSDPMVDQVVLTGLAADLNWRAVSFRRLNFDRLEGRIELTRPRSVQAVYPAVDEEEADPGRTPPMLPDPRTFLSLLVPRLPLSTLNELDAVDSDSRARLDVLTAEVEKTYGTVEELLDRTTEFVRETRTDERNPAYWIGQVGTARSILAEIDGLKRSVESTRTGMASEYRRVRSDADRIRASLSADIAAMRSSLTFDGEMLQRMVEMVAGAYLDERLARVVTGAASAARRLQGTSDSAARTKKGGGRMKSGRVVPVPVALPPRFTITQLNLSSTGISLKGTGVGVDHDLAGRPAEIEFVLAADGGDSTIVTAVIDGRSGAAESVRGSLTTGRRPWMISSENMEIRGSVVFDGTFSVSDREFSEVRVEGNAKFDRWSGSGAEVLPPPAEYPELGMNIGLLKTGSRMDMMMIPDQSSIRTWSTFLTGYYAGELLNEAAGVLPPEVTAQLESIDTTLAAWNDGQNRLALSAADLDQGRSVLEAAIREWSAKSTGVPALPDASGGLKSLGSLLGN